MTKLIVLCLLAFSTLTEKPHSVPDGLNSYPLQRATPSALLIAALGTSTAATAMQVMGQRQQSKAEEMVSKINAAIAEQEAQDAIQIAKEQQQQMARANRLFYGEQAAKANASGFAMKGSLLSSLADLEQQLNLEAAMAYRDTIAKSKRLQSEAAIHRFSAAATRNLRGYATTATLLSGAADIAKTGLAYTSPNTKP